MTATETPMAATETIEEFDRRLREWIRANLDPRAGDPSWTFDDRKRTTQAMYDAGFIGTTWPVAYGGRGLSSDYQTTFNKAVADYEWALLSSAVTVGICAATLLDYGTEEQKARYIRRMLRGDDLWTQLLSEPGAGSDLGGVSTRAVRDGDDWVLNGQKVWTSQAAIAAYSLALVRTDADLPKYAGISMMIVPLEAPGVGVRPLKQMTGESEFNEVFLDDVHVPSENLVGEINDGWAVLTRMLTHERMALSAGTVGKTMAREGFPELLALARARGVDGDPEIRHALGEIYMQRRLLDYMGVRMRRATEAKVPMGPVGSIGKIGVARLARLTAEAGVLIGGKPVTAWRDGDSASAGLARELLHFPMTAIAGGTTEIQKNIVAERVLGLPRERRADRDVPFRQLPTNNASREK